MMIRIEATMKHGDKVGIVALAIYLLGVFLLCAMWIWVNSPIWHLEVLGFWLLGGGCIISLYAAIRGSRWWLLVPTYLLCLWLLLATSKHAG